LENYIRELVGVCGTQKSWVFKRLKEQERIFFFWKRCQSVCKASSAVVGELEAIIPLSGIQKK